MNDYLGIARKFRPQTFKDVVGQDVVVTTLLNAIKYNRLAHAYLFCGSRGTGKTTLARIFAKAINCLSPLPSFEPCNQCISCRDITNGCSLDVLEIDGASNRSIDDIRKINDTVAYASSNGKFKIYIIDEVHMLTKEAFNALLKTLEEPPPKVKFFFATTEPHKVLPTILSRCQRFNLKRISIEKMVQKLEAVAASLGRTISTAALRQIAMKAEGGLRDAESLLDQIFAYYEGAIDEESVNCALGIVSKEIFFSLDREGKAGNLAAAFTLAADIFSEGKDLPFFLEGLLEHFRNLSVIKISGKNASFLKVTEEDLKKYETSASFYTKEQLLMILDICMEAHQQIRQMPSLRISLESLLLRIMRTHQRIPLEEIVDRLIQLEQRLKGLPDEMHNLGNKSLQENKPFIPIHQQKLTQAQTEDPIGQLNFNDQLVQKATVAPINAKEQVSQKQMLGTLHEDLIASKELPTNYSIKPLYSPQEPWQKIADRSTEEPDSNKDHSPPRAVDQLHEKAKSKLSQKQAADPTVAAHENRSQEQPLAMSLIEDPTPSFEDIKGFAKKIETVEIKPSSDPIVRLDKKKQAKYDTLLQFAAVELEGRIQRK